MQSTGSKEKDDAVTKDQIEKGYQSMKKVFVVLLAMVLMCSVVLASAENNIEGLWVRNGGMIVSLLKINADNTCSWIWIGTVDDAPSMEMKGTWKLSGNTLSVTNKEGSLNLGEVIKGKGNMIVTINAQTLEYILSGDTLVRSNTPDQVYYRVPE